MEYINTKTVRSEAVLFEDINAFAGNGYALHSVVAFNGCFFAVMQRETQPAEEVVTEAKTTPRKRGGNANAAK